MKRNISGPSPLVLLAALDLGRRPRRGSAPRRASRRPRRRAAGPRRSARATPAWGWSSGVPSRTKKRAPERMVADPAGGNWAARLSRSAADHAERRLVVLADDQQVVAALAAEEGRGRVLDRDRVAEPGLGRARRLGPGRGVEPLRAAADCAPARPGRRPRRRSACAPGRACAPRRARGAARDTTRGARRRARRPGRSGCPRARRWRRCRSPRRDATASCGATLFSLRIRWASVSLHCRAIRTAIWPSVLRARRERAAQALRAEQDVDAERPALPDQPVEPEGGLLRELVLLDEELLELVHDQQDARAAGACRGRCDSR